jgi:hypothetical protein
VPHLWTLEYGFPLARNDSAVVGDCECRTSKAFWIVQGTPCGYKGLAPTVARFARENAV